MIRHHYAAGAAATLPPAGSSRAGIRPPGMTRLAGVGRSGGLALVVNHRSAGASPAGAFRFAVSLLKLNEGP